MQGHLADQHLCANQERARRFPRDERFNERVQEAFAPLAALAQNANKGAEALANALMTSGEKRP